MNISKDMLIEEILSRAANELVVSDVAARNAVSALLEGDAVRSSEWLATACEARQLARDLTKRAQRVKGIAFEVDAASILDMPEPS